MFGEFIIRVFGKFIYVFNCLVLLFVMIKELGNVVFFFDLMLISFMWNVVLMVRFFVMKVVYILMEFIWYILIVLIKLFLVDGFMRKVFRFCLNKVFFKCNVVFFIGVIWLGNIWVILNFVMCEYNCDGLVIGLEMDVFCWWVIRM